MNNKSNLRFLLALGGTKVIITQEDKDLRVYSDRSPRAGALFLKRLANAVSSQ